MTVSIAPGWTFPGPANDGLLSAAHFESVNVITNSMIEYFQVSTQHQPDIGFGAKPLYLKDTIELGGWNGKINDCEQWCLQCWEPYTGANGWDACGDFTRNSSITLVAQSVSADNQMLSAGIEHPQDVSVAICTFAKEDGNAPSLTVAYPFINKEREDGSIHTFSQAVPEGRRNLVPTLRTGERWETVLKSTPRHQMTKRKGGGGGGRGGVYYGGGGGLSTEAIIGIVLGIVACIVIILIIVWVYRKKKANKAEKEKNIAGPPYEHTETTGTGAFPSYHQAGSTDPPEAYPYMNNTDTAYDPHRQTETGAHPHTNTVPLDSYSQNEAYGRTGTLPPTYQEAGVVSDARLGTELGIHGNENMARRSMERTSMSNDMVPLLRQDGVNVNAPMDRRRGSL